VELVDTDHLQDKAESGSIKKVKSMAWITAVVLPVLYMSTFMYQFGGMGDLIALIFYIPLFIIAITILRIITAPLYRVILNKSSRSVIRKVALGVLLVIVAAFLCMTYAVNILPREEVREAVKEIPAMKTYFDEHKDEFEEQRLQADDKERFSVLYDRRSNSHLTMLFRYDEVYYPASTGYSGQYYYAYKLNDYWFIEISLNLPD